MRRHGLSAIIAFACLVTAGSFAFRAKRLPGDAMISYIVDPVVQDIRLYWKDDKGQVIGTFPHLKEYLEGKNKRLVFAMNAGMFRPDFQPVGLFIENQKTITPLDTSSGTGNFYLKPNGVFYITNDNKAVICATGGFIDKGQVKFATQSGPMLLVDGVIHPAFKKASTNVNIRNGVGILPGNKLLFAMSKETVNFYDFADYFKSMGCQNALYLDGFVSRTYLPEKNWVQADGDFGVLIGVSITQK